MSTFDKIFVITIGGIITVLGIGWLIDGKIQELIAGYIFICLGVLILLSGINPKWTTNLYNLIYKSFLVRNSSKSKKNKSSFVLEKIIAPIIVSVVSGVILWFITGKVAVSGGISLIGIIISISLFSSE